MCSKIPLSNLHGSSRNVHTHTRPLRTTTTHKQIYARRDVKPKRKRRETHARPITMDVTSILRWMEVSCFSGSWDCFKRASHRRMYALKWRCLTCTIYRTPKERGSLHTLLAHACQSARVLKHRYAHEGHRNTASSTLSCLAFEARP